MKNKITMLILGFATCLAISSGLKAAAGPIPNADLTPVVQPAQNEFELLPEHVLLNIVSSLSDRDVAHVIRTCTRAHIVLESELQKRRESELQKRRGELINYWSTRKIGSMTLSGQGNIVSVAFSPDGFRLASIQAHTLKLWDLKTGIPQQIVFWGAQVAFSPVDNNLLVSWCREAPLRLLDVATSTLTLLPAIGKEDSETVAFSPDGKFLAIANDRGRVYLAPIIDRKLGKPEEINHKMTGCDITGVAFTSDHKLLVTGRKTIGGDETLSEIDIATKESSIKARIKKPVCGHSVTSPDGTTLAFYEFDPAYRSYANEQILVLWDLKANKIIKKLMGPATVYVRSLAYSPDGRLIAVGLNYRTIGILNAETGEIIKQLLPDCSACVLAFSRDGRKLAAGDRYGTITIFEAGG